MASPGSCEYLADNRNVTVMLRTVVDARGTLVHGEIVDLDGTSCGQFVDWQRLLELLQSRLSRAE